MNAAVTTYRLPIRTLTEEAFAPFGVVLSAVPDGAPPPAGERVLDLSRGRPRFYVMELKDRPAQFSSITRHRGVTQSLAAVGGSPWLLAVAPPGDVDDPDARPTHDQIAVFRVPGDVAVLMYRGTWHAGPFFSGECMSFFNLELDDTNVVDHQSCSFDGLDFLAIEAEEES
ncbi:ureidoglycolate lyase [uncultured Gordonia sp.]|uniref:ureidoglycolate lyase n=1 Tax=uncultured Gordonia sp. TaxID=198437 RepID=UPI00258FBAE9|nr:ureidoglycolate lyase [uncultured Gordonia sp.]